MDDNGNFALVRKRPSTVEKTALGAKRILSGMIEDTLAVAIAQLESWYRTGEKHYFGRGVQKNYVEAAKWFRKAAECGHKFAQTSLGACYEKGGNGFAKDYLQAVKWYSKAAEQGEAYAQNNLGACYANGIGVTKNLDEALKWYRKAAEQGNALAKTNLGLLNEKLEEAFDYSEAMESLHKMAEQGFASAQYNLGVCYWNGEDVEKDNVKATIWFRKAAEQGFVEAQKMLGFAYLNGNGVPQNDFEAYYWFRLAQEFGCENLANALVVAGAPFPSSEERERLYQEFRVQKNFKK